MAFSAHSAHSIKCLHCLTDNCVDIVYRIGMTIAECEEGVEQCVKHVYADGRIYRTCAQLDIECVNNSTVRSDDPLSVSQYCCDHNLCNGSNSNLFAGLSLRKLALLNAFLLVTILSIL